MKSFSTTIILIMMFCGITTTTRRFANILRLQYEVCYLFIVFSSSLSLVILFSHKGEQYNKNFHVLIHIISLSHSLRSLLSVVYTQPSSSLLLKSVVLLNSSKKAYRLLLDALVFAPCDAVYATYVITEWITVCAFHIGCAYVVASGPKPAIAINGNIRAWPTIVIFNAVLSFGPAVRRPYAIPQRRQANIRKAIFFFENIFYSIQGKKDK